MKFEPVTATFKLAALDKRIRAAAGGTSASKTISILMLLIDKAILAANKDGQLLISVVSESLPHLKRGAMRDFLNIMEAHGYYKEAQWNRTDFTYFFSPKVKMEFFGVDSPEKVRGPRRDILFMNEANNCPYHSFDQLEVRTKDEIWLDWNPTNEFWFYSEILPFRDTDLDFITLTYKDNEALDQNIVSSIEARKHNTSWWKVYGLGQLGEVEGKIYKDWAIIDKIPHEARLERLGLDFGYANDPAALVAIYYYNGGYIIDELIHRTHMTNHKIADYIMNSGHASTLVVADSAEPKSIAEMLEHGVQIIGANKGSGSVNQGIQYIQDQRMSMTKKSVNVIKAYRNYMWKTDKEGFIIDKPEHDYSDPMDACFVADTRIMTSEGERPIQSIEQGDLVLTRKGYRRVLSAGITGRNRPLYRLDTGGQQLVGTGNHRIWVNNGWKPLLDIRYGDILMGWKEKSASGEQTTSSIQSLKLSLIGSIFIMVKNISTGKFGKPLSEKYPRIITSITKMVIPLITKSGTCNSFIKKNMENFLGVNGYRLIGGAIPAGSYSNALPLEIGTDSVLTTAKANGAEITNSMTLKGRVFTVGRTSEPTNISQYNTVPVLAQTVQELNRRADVYNLEVEDAHEYFANGILVHNCRYAMESLRPLEDEDKVYTSGSLTKLWT